MATIKLYLDVLRPLTKFLADETFNSTRLVDYLANLKVLYPGQSVDIQRALTDGIWDGVVEYLDLVLDRQYLEEFVEVYYKLCFLDNSESQRRFPISAELWQDILNLINSQSNPWLKLRLTAIAQAIVPDGLISPAASLEDWEKTKKDLTKAYFRDMKSGKLDKPDLTLGYISKANWLKYVEISGLS